MKFAIIALLSTAIGSTVGHALDRPGHVGYGESVCREIFDLHNIWRQRGKQANDSRDPNFNRMMQYLANNPNTKTIPNNYNR